MEDIEKSVIVIDERSKRNEGRIKALEEGQKALNELVTSVKLIAEGQKRIEANVDALSEKVDSLEAQDGKKWRGLVEKVLGLLVAAVVGFALAKIGL